MKIPLNNIPDKREDKNTTSLKFKKDLINFFGDKYKDSVCLEIGTHRGYTTYILSFLFKKVITCEINPELISFAKNVNKDRNNIEFLQKDVYNTKWEFDEDIDVVFIDCDHHIISVLHDIQNSINLCKPGEELLIVFDDYGLDNPWPGIKEAIHEYKNNPYFTKVTEIGEEKGSDCNPRVNLREVEGVIYKYKNPHVIQNIVFIPNIDLGNGRSDSYKYSIKSWKRWCDKNNCSLLVLDELLYPIEDMKITWQRYELFNILEANEIKYDQVAMVDCDTIIRPDTPNFFDLTERKYCGVQNDGCYEWVNRSIREYSKYFFPQTLIHPWEYINGGFQIVNPDHKSFFDKMLSFYKDNKDKLIHAQTKLIRTGSDQTPLNFMLKKHNIDVKVLPNCFNLQDPHRKSLLYLDKNMWWEDTIDNLVQSGYIIHFNAIPANPLGRDSKYWMERVYKELS